MMNKLVIVGNGFDKAHDLPTAYKDFINDFWASLGKNLDNPLVSKVLTFNLDYLNGMQLSGIEDFKDFTSTLKKYCESSKYDYNGDLLFCRNKKTAGFSVVFEFKNKLFREINRKSIDNWVDIENEYFAHLKALSKRKVSSYSGSPEEADKKQKEKNKSAVLRLNEEFEEIKYLLKDYLTNNIHEKFNFLNGRIINYGSLLRHLEVKPLYLSKTNENEKFLNEFSLPDHKNIIDFDNQLVESEIKGNLKGFIDNSNRKTVFLNFNYTDSVHHYVSLMKNGKYGFYFEPDLIQIHGHLKNTGDYEIFFGFGDEMDEDYSFIENLNDNEYLKFFKSFMYSKTPYYKKLLDFIESQEFQVFIMGHSCGLSDRTMLNTIFEHENCRSIKVFYHQREDGSDNFSDIIQNISRHFNDKKKMREKIVNKSLCHPMPQTMRFEKK